jgi:hypothetical protein
MAMERMNYVVRGDVEYVVTFLCEFVACSNSQLGTSL